MKGKKILLFALLCSFTFECIFPQQAKANVYTGAKENLRMVARSIKRRASVVRAYFFPQKNITTEGVPAPSKTTITQTASAQSATITTSAPSVTTQDPPAEVISLKPAAASHTTIRTENTAPQVNATSMQQEQGSYGSTNTQEPPAQTVDSPAEAIPLSQTNTPATEDAPDLMATNTGETLAHGETGPAMDFANPIHEGQSNDEAPEDPPEEESEEFELWIEAASAAAEAIGVGKDIIASAREGIQGTLSLVRTNEVQEALDSEYAGVDYTNLPFALQFQRYLDALLAGRSVDPERFGPKRSYLAIVGPRAIGKGIEYVGSDLPLPFSGTVSKVIGKGVQMGLNKVARAKVARYAHIYSLYKLGLLSKDTAEILGQIYAPIISSLTPEERTDLARQAAINAMYFLDHRVRAEPTAILNMDADEVVDAIGRRYVDLDYGLFPSWQTFKNKISRRSKFWKKRKKRLTKHKLRYLLTSTPVIVATPDGKVEIFLPNTDLKAKARSKNERRYLRGRAFQDKPIKLREKYKKRFGKAYRSSNHGYVRGRKMKLVKTIRVQ